MSCTAMSADDSEHAVIAAMNYGEGFADGAKLDRRLMSLALEKAIHGWYGDNSVYHDNIVRRMLDAYVKLKQEES